MKLGFVVTGADSEPGYEHTGYQYYDRGYGYRGQSAGALVDERRKV